MEIVKVENLNKIYGTNENKVIALDDINFSIDKGDFVVILVLVEVESQHYFIYLVVLIDQQKEKCI